MEAYELEAGRESYEVTITASVYGGDQMRGSALSCTVELHTYEVCQRSQRILSIQQLRFPYSICSAEVNPVTAGIVAETAVSVIAEQIQGQGLPLPDFGNLRDHIRFCIIDSALRIPPSRRSESCIEFQVAMHAMLVRVTTPGMQLLRSPPSTAMAAEEAAPDQLAGTTEEDGDGGDDDCAICLEKVTAGGGRCFLPCSHSFHRNCIARWLQRKADCPLCRAAIII